MKKMLIILIAVFNPCYSFELGIGTHFSSYPGQPDKYLQLIKSYGFTSIRDDYTWNKIEDVKDDFNSRGKIAKVDKAINQAASFNINTLVILDYGNKHYNSNYYPNTEESLNAYNRYVEWTARHLKGKVKYYEIWNEWTIGTGIKKDGKIPPSVDDYYNLVKLTSATIRKEDPNAIILAGSINPLSDKPRFIGVSDEQWITALIKKGMLEYIDGISLHPYSYANSSERLRTVKGNIDAIDSFHDRIKLISGKEIPFYITEMGVPTHYGHGGVSLDEQSDFINEYSREVMNRKYIKGLWWYDLINDGGNILNKEDNFGFFYENLSPKPVMQNFKKNLISK
ncbi:hypothetical protein CWN41_27435 [Klebsiella quasipneumoniae]|uniref:cellulase family glycosylhydrolase n=1 Tax=Klebsiella quasipneumoniae TaxID=1463165 RepID=UPI000C79C837|nr:cellulase family glycosylhydrolase [Klebsiella quasipneumoniae]PLM26481.1 hypothetical protein CWN41_27435 [Klebsiella quasipneumoniae]